MDPRGEGLEAALQWLAQRAPERLTLRQALLFVMVARRDPAVRYTSEAQRLTLSAAQRSSPIGQAIKRSYTTLVQAGLIEKESGRQESRDQPLQLTNSGRLLWHEMLRALKDENSSIRDT